jgi:hypothetical protein
MLSKKLSFRHVPLAALHRIYPSLIAHRCLNCIRHANKPKQKCHTSYDRKRNDGQRERNPLQWFRKVVLGVFLYGGRLIHHERRKGRGNGRSFGLTGRFIHGKQGPDFWTL